VRVGLVRKGRGQRCLECGRKECGTKGRNAGRLSSGGRRVSLQGAVANLSFSLFSLLSFLMEQLIFPVPSDVTWPRLPCSAPSCRATSVSSLRSFSSLLLVTCCPPSRPPPHPPSARGRHTCRPPTGCFSPLIACALRSTVVSRRSPLAAARSPAVFCQLLGAQPDPVPLRSCCPLLSCFFFLFYFLAQLLVCLVLSDLV